MCVYEENDNKCFRLSGRADLSSLIDPDPITNQLFNLPWTILRIPRVGLNIPTDFTVDSDCTVGSWNMCTRIRGDEREGRGNSYTGNLYLRRAPEQSEFLEVWLRNNYDDNILTAELFDNVTFWVHGVRGTATTRGEFPLTMTAFLDSQLENGNEYYFPTGANPDSGFANINDTFYPISLGNGGELTFKAYVTGSLASMDITFRFEREPFPNVNPSFTLAPVNITNTVEQEYIVPIPPQTATDTYASIVLNLLSNNNSPDALVINDLKLTLG